MATTDSTTGTGTSKKDVLALVEEHDIQFIRLWFTDILGQLKSFAVGKDELEGALEEGMGFDGSSITGFNRIEESDMIAMPDPSTFAVLPWRPQEKAVARMFCDVLVPGGEPYEGDPRYVMRRALERAQSMGFDTFNIGPELEFFYFRSSELNGGPPQVLDKGGYFDLTTLDAASDMRRETVLALERLGIHVEYTHHEVGPSQHEIDMRFASGLRDGRQRDDVPHHGQGDRDEVRRVRDVHAEAAVRRERVGDARAPVAVQRRAQRVLRPGRRVPPERDGEVVHRRPAQARARDLAAVRAVGELVQAARARLRGAGLHRVVAAQPLRADPGADVPPRQGAGDALPSCAAPTRRATRT